MSSRRRRALTLGEALVATVVVGVMLVAALNTAGGARLARRNLADQCRAELLAQQLMAEITSLPYTDPDGLGLLLGSDGVEALAPGRSGFDDVDDFDGWSATPPQLRDGTVLADLSGWRQEVTVNWVNPNQIDTVRLTDSGAKRIVVTIRSSGGATASLTALRTSADSCRNLPAP
jgi:type II secretory pathway pseudopilin PulG